MSASPKICPECGHRFPPGTPEPSCCPDCQRLCTGDRKSEELKSPTATEMLVTSGERAGWRTGFWLCLCMGPVLAALFMVFRQDIVSPVPLSSFSSHAILSLGFSAAGAGICLANVRFARRRFADKLAHSFLLGIDVLAAYAGMLLVGGVVRALMFK